MQTSFDSLKRRLMRTSRSLHGDGRGWTLLVVAAGWLAILGGRYLFPAILPQIKAFFDVSNATAGLAITVIWAGYAVMQFPAGVLVDRLGERSLLTASLAVAAASVVVVGLAPSFWLFMVGCGVFGLGTGLYGPARGTALSNTFESDGAAFGLTLAAGSVGSAAFPLAASLLVDSLGWQTTVLLLIAPFLVVAVGAWRAIPQFTLAGGPGERYSARRLLGALRTAVSRRAVVVASSAVTLMLFVLQGLTAFLPVYLITIKGISQEVAAVLFALFFISGAVSQSVAGGLADYYGDRMVLLTTAVFGVFPLLALPFVGGLVPLGILSVLLGIRLAAAPVNNAYIVAVLPDSVQGTAWGFLRTGYFLLGSTASTFVGILFDRGLAGEAFVALAVLTAIAAVCYAFLPARETA
ncbi:MAG TPA: MFS transporter [Halococcus sp.]|nr:MFS transporter [Halococcus sp.]